MKEKEKKILSTKSMFIFAFGVFGLHLLIGLMNSYQSQFYTSMFKADLMIVAAIILVAKVLSAFADIFIGNIIDRNQLKAGKMRPFILYSALPMAILTMIMFIYIPFPNTTGGIAGMYIYITILTILWNIAMSFADIPSQGMIPLLSPKANERDSVAGITNVLKSIGLAAPGLVIPIICMITKNAGIGKLEYFIAALFLSILGITLYILIYFFNKETVISAPTKMSFKEMGKELKSNKLLIIVILTFLLGFGRNMAMGITVQGAAVLVKNGVDLWIGSWHYTASGENLSWLIATTSAVSSMISIITIPLINKKLGEKKTFIIYGIYGFAVALISFILYITGVQALRSLWAILVYQFFVGFSFGPNGYLPVIMVSDIVDYQEWKNGKRTEGTQFAILTLSNKISNALSVAIGIFIVGASGYVGGMVGNAITNKMQDIVFSAYILIPGICMLLSSIPMFFYNLDFKTKKQMREELKIRRNKLQSLIETQNGEVKIDEKKIDNFDKNNNNVNIQNDDILNDNIQNNKIDRKEKTKNNDKMKDDKINKKEKDKK